MCGQGCGCGGWRRRGERVLAALLSAGTAQGEVEEGTGTGCRRVPNKQEVQHSTAAARQPPTHLRPSEAQQAVRPGALSGGGHGGGGGPERPRAQQGDPPQLGLQAGGVPRPVQANLDFELVEAGLLQICRGMWRWWWWAGKG